MSLFPLDRAKSSEITRLTLEPLGSEKGEREREGGGRRRGFFPTARYRFSVIPIGAASLTRYSNRIRLYRAIDVPIVLEGHSMSSSLRGKGPRFPRYDSTAFDPVKRVRFDPSKSNFFRSTVFPHLPFFPLGIRTSPNYLDSSWTRYSWCNWCSLCPRFVFVAISRWMDEKYDELLERINWLTMIERFIDIFFFSPTSKCISARWKRSWNILNLRLDGKYRNVGEGKS